MRDETATDPKRRLQNKVLHQALLAAGDFQISIDGGAFANLATLPTVTPAGGRAVKISLSAAEMTGDNIVVQAVDAAGAEWCDLFIDIETKEQAIPNLHFVMRDTSGNPAGQCQTVSGVFAGGAGRGPRRLCRCC